MSLRILLVGFGKLAQGVFSELSSEHQFDALKRSGFAQKPDSIGRCFAGDLASEATWKAIPNDYDLVLICVSPGSRDSETYRSVFLEGAKQCIRHFEGQATPHILFVSSTSVYAQDDDSWVDESSPAKGSSESSRFLVSAEQVLRESVLSTTVVRFSGIYGAGRNRLINQVKEGRARLDSVERYTNRIHEADCVGFLVHLIRRIAQGQSVLPCYLATDSRPVSSNEVLAFIAEKLEVSLEEGKTVDAGVPGRAGSKRCSNKQMLASGYVLKYPSYVEGYAEALASDM